MAGFSNTLELYILDHIFDVAAYTATSIWVSLHSGDPGETGANELTSAGSYARARASHKWASAGSGAISNNAAITFPTASADWNGGGTLSYFGIFTTVSGSTFLASGTLRTAKAITNGDTASFASSGLTVTLD